MVRNILYAQRWHLMDFFYAFKLNIKNHFDTKVINKCIYSNQCEKYFQGFKYFDGLEKIYI